MHMKVKDIGAANGLLPPKLRMPGQMSTPFGSGDGFSRKHQIVTPCDVHTAVENNGNIDDDSARKGRDVSGTSNISNVDSVVLELRAKHADKLEEDLRSIGVLRQDNPCALHAESTHSSTSAPDTQKSPASGSGSGGSRETQVADVSKVCSSPIDAAAMLHEKQHDGKINETTDPVSADCHVKYIPADPATSRDSLSTSSRVPVKKRHLKAFTVEGQTQTSNVSPTAIEADVLASGCSGVTVTSAPAQTRDVATVGKWDKTTNSSDYDADDDDDCVDDGCRLRERPHTPRTAVSRWGHETYRRNETEQSIEKEVNGTEQQFGEERKVTKWQYEDEPNDQVEDEPNDQVEDEPNDQVEDEPNDQVEDEPNDQVEDETNEQVEDEPNEQVEDEPNEQVEHEPNEQVEDEPNMTEWQVDDERNVTEQQVDEERTEMDQHVEAKQNETNRQVDEDRNEIEQEVEEEINWQNRGVNERSETVCVDGERNETGEAEGNRNETELHVEKEQHQKKFPYVSTRRSNRQKNDTRRETIDSFANARKYLMKHAPEECTEVPEMPTYTEKMTQAPATPYQVWPLFCVITIK